MRSIQYAIVYLCLAAAAFFALRGPVEWEIERWRADQRIDAGETDGVLTIPRSGVRLPFSESGSSQENVRQMTDTERTQNGLVLVLPDTWKSAPDNLEKDDLLYLETGGETHIYRVTQAARSGSGDAALRMQAGAGTGSLLLIGGGVRWETAKNPQEEQEYGQYSLLIEGTAVQAREISREAARTQMVTDGVTPVGRWPGAGMTAVPFAAGALALTILVSPVMYLRCIRPKKKFRRARMKKGKTRRQAGKAV